MADARHVESVEPYGSDCRHRPRYRHSSIHSVMPLSGVGNQALSGLLATPRSDRRRFGRPLFFLFSATRHRQKQSPLAPIGCHFDAFIGLGNCGANGWAITPSGMRGVLNNALSIYFLDPTLASAFVARWCAGYMVETAEGVFRVRDDEPTPRGGAASDALSGLYPADRRRRGAHQGHPLWHEHLELDGLRCNGAHP